MKIDRTSRHARLSPRSKTSRSTDRTTRFIESMVYGERPEFTEAFATVKELADLFLDGQ